MAKAVQLSLYLMTLIVDIVNLLMPYQWDRSSRMQVNAYAITIALPIHHHDFWWLNLASVICDDMKKPMLSLQAHMSRRQHQPTIAVTAEKEGSRRNQYCHCKLTCLGDNIDHQKLWQRKKKGALLPYCMRPPIFVIGYRDGPLTVSWHQSHK